MVSAGSQGRAALRWGNGGAGPSGAAEGTGSCSAHRETQSKCEQTERSPLASGGALNALLAGAAAL